MSATAASSITWEQYNETGRRLFAEGDLAGAEDAFVAAIAEAERAGGDPLQLASSLGNLAQLKYQQKDHLRAEELFRRSLELREQSLGSDHPSVLTSINNLAALYVSRGALDEAEPLLKRAMTASAKRVDSAQTDLGVNLNNLARLYFKRGDYGQAEPLLLQLLTLKRPYGPEHPEVATVLVSLAKVRHSLGKPDQAERLWRRVLIVRERQLPASDPAVLQAMDGLSDSLAAMGKHAAALDLRERSLKAREENMGGDHPTVAQARAKVDESRAATAASLTPAAPPMPRPRRISAELKTGPSDLTPRAGTPALRDGVAPSAPVAKNATRIPTPTAPKPAAPPAAPVTPAPEPVAAAPAPEAPAKPKDDDLNITEAWADDPELPPPKANRVSEQVKRVSVPVVIEQPRVSQAIAVDMSIAPEPLPPKRPSQANPVVEPKRPSQSNPVVEAKRPSQSNAVVAKEPEIGFTQALERMSKTPTPTPPPVVVSSRTPTPSPSLAAVEQRKPRIGFGAQGEGSKKMMVIAGGALAACLVIGAIIVVPRMSHSAPAAAPKTPVVAQAQPAPQQPAAAQPAAPQPTPTQAAAEPAQPTQAAEQPREGFAAHMGPAAPAPTAEEPDSSAAEHAKPTPKSGSIKLSRAPQAPAANDVALPSAPSLNLDEASKAIDSTAKSKKKKADSIAVPSF